MENHIVVKENFDIDYLLKGNHKSCFLLLIIWKHSKFRKDNIPILFYRLGYYLTSSSDGNSPFFVGSTDLKQITKFYFSSNDLQDFPIAYIDLEIDDIQKRISFIEIYDLDSKSLHYIIPRITEYHNPFDRNEKYFTEVLIKRPQKLKDSINNYLDNEDEEMDFSALRHGDGFTWFFERTFKTSDKESINISSNYVNQKEDKEERSLKYMSMYKKRSEGNTSEDKEEETEPFGIMWLNEVHWKKVYKCLGIVSEYNLIMPVYTLPFIEQLIDYVRTILLENILKYLSYDDKSYPDFVSHNMSSIDIKFDLQVALAFCVSEIANAFVSCRKSINKINNKIDFGDRFALITFQDILNNTRTQYDPFDPFRDDIVARFYGWEHSSSTKYVSYMQKLDQYMFRLDDKNLEKDQNMIKIRIINGSILSLTRNGVTYGKPDYIIVPPAMNKLNTLIQQMETMIKRNAVSTEHTKKFLQNYEKDCKESICSGFNDVETTVYLIDANIYIFTPILPRGHCFRGKWCTGDISNTKLCEAQTMLTKLCNSFYEYDSFMPIKHDLVKQCLNLLS